MRTGDAKIQSAILNTWLSGPKQTKIGLFELRLQYFSDVYNNLPQELGWFWAEVDGRHIICRSYDSSREAIHVLSPGQLRTLHDLHWHPVMQTFKPSYLTRPLLLLLLAGLCRSTYPRLPFNNMYVMCTDICREDPQDVRAYPLHIFQSRIR